MTIRKRLALFILLMTSLLAAMGALLFFGGPVILTAFRQSLDSMNALDTIREVRSNLTRQRTSLNRYLLLDDPQELITFDESVKAGKPYIDALRRRVPAGSSNILQIATLYDKTVTAAEDAVQRYRRGQKAAAYEQATALYDHLIEDVRILEEQKSVEAQVMFERIRRLTLRVEVLVIFSLLGAFMIGVLLFRSLYRSVMLPLEALRKGAVEFGRGHWDHRIEPPSAKEFGSLAEAFNTMAENVKQLQLQAVHMDRMSAVGQLAGGVAHEINNPLTAVLGQAQILMARLGEKDPSFAQLQKIEQAALRCKKIVRGLLDFSRPSQTSFEDIDIGSVLAATLDLCEADLKRARVTVEKRLPKALPVIEGNGSELQQVLLNLINNAIQAMPRGGSLLFETRVSHDPITLVDRRKAGNGRRVNGPWLEVQVKDNGVGIAKEHLSRVFEPFFTTKEIGKGTGLGLAVSLGIVQKHGGDLRVDSGGAGKGATFMLLLPLKRPAAGTGTAERRPGLAA